MLEKIDYPDDLIRKILRETRTIAMVGSSANWNRPSYFAMKYLQRKGYRVIPVNPKEAGGEILGETVYAALKDIPEQIDMVDIFRNSEAAGAVTDEADGARGAGDFGAGNKVVGGDAARLGANRADP